MVGASHRRASLALLERLSVRTADLSGVLGELTARVEVAGVVVLSTCNRTELYACCRRFHGGVEELVDFLARRAGVAAAELVPHLIVSHDDTALTHLFRVAAGVESAVMGETEILGQIRHALSRAEADGAASPLLSRAFRHAIRTGRRARAATGVGTGPSSMPSIAAQRAADHLGGLVGRHALILGAGEMGRAVGAALGRAGVAGIDVAGGGSTRAEALAATLGGKVVASGGLAEALEVADAVFTATTAPGFLIHRQLCASVMARRRHRPLAMVDLAMPRDVDPEAATVPGVALFDLDDLKATAAEVLAERRRHLPDVERLVAGEVERFLRETSARDMTPLVSALRCRVEDVRRAELRRWQARIGPLDPRAAALAEEITAGVVAKLLHGPTAKLKDSARTARAETYRSVLVELFDLDPTEAPPPASSSAFGR